MRNYCIKKEDLIGALDGFPLDVVKSMIEEQVMQGNEPDVTVFQHQADAYKKDGGFEWSSSKYGYEFWMETIYHANFDYFYKNR